MKVIAYEGLFNHWFGLFGSLKRSLNKNIPELEVDSRSWLDKRPIPKDSIVIGHSFGGLTALKMAKEHGARILFTLDVRGLDVKNNAHHKRVSAPDVPHFNYYQRKGLRGYQIVGADDFPVDDYNHMQMPFNIYFLNDLRSFLMEARGERM